MDINSALDSGIAHTSGISTDPTVSPTNLWPRYEELLPTELQCAVMSRLIKVDPKSALRLSMASRQQAAVLESLCAQLVAINPLLVATGNVTPSAVDYLRAHIAMGCNRDPQAFALLWLLESFVRFLFSEPEWSANRRIRHAAAGRIIGAISSDMVPGGARAAVQAWYRWLTVRSTELQCGRAISDAVIDSLFAKHAGPHIAGRTHSSGDVDLFYLRRIGVRLDGAVAPDAPDTVQTALSFGPRYQTMSYQRLCKILGVVTPDQLEAWAQREQTLDTNASRLIAERLSSGSYARMAQFIDQGVRQNATDAYASLLRAGRLRIADFTSSVWRG
ncbi:hypothetical protein pkur_cds_403 [Pandoravirus kuranda]|uniref:Uncharacterized protein n=1 Tax=Pandoravirus kuranda TaxID=3019033 RepID=A0AA95J4C6_9VIRU|nr:hypothetical protein pkur_cds_403 [Pandoravirus kuranda]